MPADPPEDQRPGEQIDGDLRINTRINPAGVHGPLPERPDDPATLIQEELAEELGAVRIGDTGGEQLRENLTPRAEIKDADPVSISPPPR